MMKRFFAFAFLTLFLWGSIARSEVIFGAVTCSGAATAKPVQLADVLAAAISGVPELLIAKEAVEKAQASVLAARTPFLPNISLSFQSERFVPSSPSPPVTVGNVVVGGSFETRTSYASVGMNWNLYSGGRDRANLRAAQSDAAGTEASLNHQLGETVLGVLNTYLDVYKAQRDALAQSRILALQQQMEQRAEAQFRQGTTTTLAIAHAQTEVLQTAQQLYQSCRMQADKSAALAQAIGVHLGADELFRVDDVLPAPMDEKISSIDWQHQIKDDPAVVAAHAGVTSAEAKLSATHAGFGPSLVLEGRRDYLGQDRESWRAANHISPNSYRLGLVLQQPLAPLTSEYAAVRGANSDVRRAQAIYQQTLLEIETKYHQAFNALRQFTDALLAARQNLDQARQLLSLSEALFTSGRTDKDKVQQAQVAVEKAMLAVDQAIADHHFARWQVLRVSESQAFSSRVTRQFVQ